MVKENAHIQITYFTCPICETKVINMTNFDHIKCTHFKNRVSHEKFKVFSADNLFYYIFIVQAFLA